MTERARTEALALGAALAFLLVVGGLARVVAGHRGGALIAAGASLAVLRLVGPGLVAWALAPLAAALRRVGEHLARALLTVLYLVLVWPYAAVLRALKVLEPPVPPWPPPAHASGWLPVRDAASAGPRQRLRPAALWARAAVRAGDGVALLAWFWSRPTLFLLPIVLLALVLAALALFGSATGLGPLVYTFF